MASQTRSRAELPGQVMDRFYLASTKNRSDVRGHYYQVAVLEYVCRRYQVTACDAYQSRCFAFDFYLSPATSRRNHAFSRSRLIPV